MTITGSRVLHAPSRLLGSLGVPADKSIAHRALICAALSTGESRISLQGPVGADIHSTLGALRALWVPIETGETDGRLVVNIRGLGDGIHIGRLGGGVVDCGNSGTTMRLLAGALASGSGVATLIGDESLSTRPMARVAAPLRLMDAEVLTTDGHAPVTVTGIRPLRAVEHRLATPSAQVLGSICFAALAAAGTTRVFVPGPTRDHTERMLAAMGVSISREDAHDGTMTTIDGPAALESHDLEVPGDFSSAAAWIVAASIHHDATLELVGVGLNPTRTALIDVLRRMGADIHVFSTGTAAGEPVGDLTVRSSGGLTSTTVDEKEVPALIDELPLLAVAMAAADGISEVRGASELRVKESDRITTMAQALSRTGARVEELPDGWRISAGRPLDANIATHGDHRIGMAMAVAAWSGIAKSVVLDDPGCVDVSYPTFWRDGGLIGAKS